MKTMTTRQLFRPVLAVAVLLCLGAAVLLTGKFRPAFARWAESRIKLIDDFNDGDTPNLIGGEPFQQAAAGALVSPAVLRIHTPSPGDMALAVAYDVPKGMSAEWGTGLNDLDISAAKLIRFWLRADHLPLPDLRVEVIDGYGGISAVKLPRLQGTNSWQLVSIPTRDFRGVDFNRLNRFILRIGAPNRPVKGTVDLDDLEFVGPPNVFFRSLEDNLYGFPHRALVNSRRLLAMSSDQMLRAIAGDTWGYFRDLVDHRHHLPMNYVQTKPIRQVGDYASTTDIAMYLMAVVSAYDLDLIDHESAVTRIRGTLEQLAKLPKWHNFFYNYYSTTNLQITNQYISSVDNGWLAVALIVIRQAFPDLSAPASALLAPMNFGEFYDPSNGQMRLGYEVEKGRMAPYHYGLLATEARIISMVAIGKGDVPEDHWFKVFRTLPKEWTWQRQVPQGEYKRYLGHDVFQGYYTYVNDGHKVPFVPSWGGSLFEFLMPTLVVDERRLAAKGLGLNDEHAVHIHMHYALKERGFPVWGLSPCATPKERHGGYSEYGVAALGAKGYKDEAIVTPHVSMLALGFEPDAVIKNLREMIRRYQIYGSYGLYDSVDVDTGDVTYRYLALDQGMSLIALDNYLTNGAIQRRFERDPIMKRMKGLLQAEQFFDSDAAASPTSRQ